MNEPSKQPRKSLVQRLRSLWRRKGSDHLEISGYHVGDVDSERPVHVARGSAVAGNIAAPQVVVSGLTYGFVTTRELIVLGGGQVWGDVFAAAAQVHPDSKVNGWLSTFDEGTLDLIRAGELGVSDAPATQSVGLPAALVQRIQELERDYLLQVDERSQPWLGVFRKLSLEAATAMLARQELESTLSGPAAAAATAAGELVSRALEPGAGSESGPGGPEIGSPTGDQAAALSWANAGLAAAEAQLAQRRDELASLLADSDEGEPEWRTRFTAAETRLVEREAELERVAAELAETKTLLGRVIGAASARVARLEREISDLQRQGGL